ncbi:MAG: hypothetical protein QN162_03890, partial [Armatimonadota bacterium]|nr:hypothetical protein [Armatimonadota bacterium]
MVTDLPPRGDQPQAIAGLIESVRAGHRYTTLLGVTGSGKSVTAGTPVFLKRGSRLTLETIGEVIDRAMTAQPDDVRRQGDTEILARVGPADYLEALSFDPGTGTVSWKPVRQLVRHRSPDVLYTLSTGCGREVTVTGDHNFFVLRRGQLHLVRTTDIRPGDFLPMPRALPEPGESLRHLPLIEALGHDPRVDATEPHSHQCR